MVNGMGVLGWGVGGIEAEAAMLGQPIAMLIPDVIGFRLTGTMPEGATATDLVLTVTQMLRKKGVVGKFVEFYGPALDTLPLADRATIGNMAPEYGATCGFFPIDDIALDYLRQTGRDEDRIAMVEAYLRAQGMFRDSTTPEPVFTDTIELDIGTVEPSLSGPKRPQDRVPLKAASFAFKGELTRRLGVPANDPHLDGSKVPVAGANYGLAHGDVVIAAITSCTNTSNPYVLVAAGLVARKARAKGLKPKPWVKTSLAPGSQVVTEYLDKAGLSRRPRRAGLQPGRLRLHHLHRQLGPARGRLGRRDRGQQAGRRLRAVRQPQLRGPRLAQRARQLPGEPAAGGRLRAARHHDGGHHHRAARHRLGRQAGVPPDIWPTNKEIADLVASSLSRDQFIRRYGEVTQGTKEWKALKVETGSETYRWNDGSTYVKNPPYFEGITMEPVVKGAITGARVLALLGDNITTDHISPAGSIKKSSPAGEYLGEHQVRQADFNSYGSRRGNHEVMMRGTFANIRIKNEMLAGVEGGLTKHQPSGEQMPIYDAAMRYKAEGVPLIVFGGKEYGMGSSRDWAAKGTVLLGIRAVVAESFERIHRSNLVGMGVLPFLFPEGVTRETLGLKGDETIDLVGLETITPRMRTPMRIHRADGSTDEVSLICRVDTLDEVEYYRHGGILQYVLRGMAKAA